MAREAMITAHGLAVDAVVLVPMVAAGDKILDRALADVGGKALWTRELDRALADGTIDAAVHSMKDVETERPMRFTIAAMLPRADVRDRLIGAVTIAALPVGARIGTSSPRRTAQILSLRPDVVPVLLRGNVGTRLAKIANGECDATFLAAAGLDRLGMADIGHAIEDGIMLPAPQQGAIGIEVRSDDGAAAQIVSAINHPPTLRAVLCERAFLAAVGGDCRSPIAALATIDADGKMTLQAQLLSGDGTAELRDIWTGPASGTNDGSGDAQGARTLARHMLANAPALVSAMFAP